MPTSTPSTFLCTADAGLSTQHKRFARGPAARDARFVAARMRRRACHSVQSAAANGGGGGGPGSGCALCFFASATRNSATFGARFPIRTSATKRVVRKLRSCGVADLSCAMPTSENISILDLKVAIEAYISRSDRRGARSSRTSSDYGPRRQRADTMHAHHRTP